MKVSYLRKSESYLQSAKLLRDNEHFEEAVSLAYYRYVLLGDSPLLSCRD